MTWAFLRVKDLARLAPILAWFERGGGVGEILRAVEVLEGRQNILWVQFFEVGISFCAAKGSLNRGGDRRKRKLVDLLARRRRGLSQWLG